MNYESSTHLSDTKFKRLVGVKRQTFNEMLACLEQAQASVYQKGGRKLKLSHWVENTLIQNGFHLQKQDIKDDDIVMVDVTEIKVNRPKKNQKLSYFGKKKHHTAKVQLITNSKGDVLQVDISLTQKHDFSLFKHSKQRLHKTKFILADSGYQGIQNGTSKPLYPKSN